MTRDLTPRTRLISPATRRPQGARRPVNPPVERASTLLNPRVGVMTDPTLGAVYGLEGLTVQRELRATLAGLEGSANAWITPSGLSAVTIPLLALTRPGDEILASEAAYGPSRLFLDRFMAERGVAVRYHPARVTADELVAAIGEQTRLVLIESPASLTFEMIDVAAVAAGARARGALTVMDNTWAAGLLFRPLAHGVDVSVQAATKYAAGHSDLLMGAVAAADPAIDAKIGAAIELMGWHVAPDDAYLALRGLRTLPLRLAEHGASALKVAAWLAARPETAQVLYPPLPGAPDHDLWARDYTGGCGLMGVMLSGGDAAAACAMLDALQLFGLGFSWGGFESLATFETPQLARRLHPPTLPGPLIRLHIGLEDPDDLIADLEQALDRYREARR